MELVEAQLVSAYEKVVVADVEEHALGWLVFGQSAEYRRSREFGKQLVGMGPYLVDGQDGSLHYIPVTTFVDGWEEPYLQDVRGIRPPDPLPAAVRDIAGRDGVLAAVRYLRARTSALSPAEAKAYAEAVRDGGEPPAELSDRTRPRLPRPVFPIETITAAP